MTESSPSALKDEVNMVLFDTMYRRKITISDWFMTKKGVILSVTLLALLLSGSLGTYQTMGFFVIFLYSYMKEDTLLVEKENKVYGYIKRREIAQFFKQMRVDDYKKLIERNEGYKTIDAFTNPVQEESIVKTLSKKPKKKTQKIARASSVKPKQSSKKVVKK